jgi:queuine tRNA-ribosyltransferase
MFRLKKKSNKSQARVGILKTRRGSLVTPFFMPIATQGAVKSLTSEEVKNIGAKIILANTYHLYLRPGIKVFNRIGDLHQLMKWSGPILTDSGGYQVFSLAGTKNRRDNLVKIETNKVHFTSHIDGSKHEFTPAKVLQMQKLIGSDIQMILDICTSYPASREVVIRDVATTLRWARKTHQLLQAKKYQDGSLRFAIVQGGVYKDLRKACARELVNLHFDGYAIGGLAVGETHSQMYQVLTHTVPELPENKPRYLMGVGKPENIIKAVELGVDMFDCVIPTREARHGRLYIWRNDQIQKKNFYTTINIKSAKYRYDSQMLYNCKNAPELAGYSRAYLHHLFKTNEALGLRLATLTNLHFYLDLMEKIRQSIISGFL